MHSLTTRSAVLFGAALLSAVAAGCGSSGTAATVTTSAHGVTTAHDMQGMATANGAHAGHTMTGTSSGAGMTPLVAGADGTSASAAGLTLKASTATIPNGTSTAWTLQVFDTQGMPVTQFDRDQTKLMHLIVARTDFTGYQHLHPVLGSNGLFTVPLSLPAPGSYRAIADFTTAGKRYALGVPVTAPGSAVAVPLPPVRPAATVDGYKVALQHEALSSSTAAQLTFTITRAGQPVTALQPYLGAFGHLVALRKPDLAYSHVHPTGHDKAAATITFDAEFASSAIYRLYLQFQTAGRVHTAPFTVIVAK